MLRLFVARIDFFLTSIVASQLFLLVDSQHHTCAVVTRALQAKSRGRRPTRGDAAASDAAAR